MLHLPQQDTDQKLASIRAYMAQNQLDAYIFPSNDPHQSEYVAEHWKGREWLSGFDGSAGTVVVTALDAGMWTDSRYFLQAAQQLKGSPISFQKLEGYSPKAYYEWIKQQLPKGGRLGIDGKLVSYEGLKALKTEFEGAGIALVTEVDMLALAWENRPGLPHEQIFEHEAKFWGQSRAEKLAFLREALQQHKCQHHLLSTLDDIAWLFNLRGRDVECNPVFYGYAIVSENAATLFVDLAKVPMELREQLLLEGIDLANYADFESALDQMEGNILVDRHVFPFSFEQRFGKNAHLVHAANPSTLKKACKNENELQHLRKTMEQDGAALVELMMMVEQALRDGQNLTEYEVSEMLIGCRAKREGYFGESFGAIAGYEGNGAIVHYRPSATDSASLRAEGVLLLDSGGQYQGGTTDVTRTFALGSVPFAAKSAFSRVLKGHLALGKAKFPKGTNGLQLDVLARNALWQAGLNYGHGTGHGVGFFLNVHEGPQSIGPSASAKALQALLPGMIISNEPGYYEEGQFGIRIENLIVVKALEGHPGFLEFESLTLFPYDWNMMDFSLLNSEEMAMIEAYHDEVLERLSPLLDEAGKAWLAAKCQSPLH